MNVYDQESENSLSWFIEEMLFETIREAHEWVYSGAYNDIGYLFDGYKTKDSKLAYALLFELVRSNTIHGYRHDVHCDEEYLEGSITYKVWITNKTYESPAITIK
ncbi:hypothetical protein PBAT_07900 [Paenibacillus antarcticus]|uniref:Uncharacterized protein n=1 Tax=Paenibacillus antarcticus TaxID=253703 RepID=A0A168PYF7_9BACL|nr:hypothetical protein [Paenibacillus antarcticus]OAB47189.1 hypothetical protein PBAT_07900 [Paenibacillus antarcticus]